MSLMSKFAVIATFLIVILYLACSSREASMSEHETLWKRHRIEQIGLSIEIYQPWRLDTLINVDAGNIYQRIADTGGLVFVRFGKEETIESFVPTLNNLVMGTSVISDENLVYGGRDARRVKLISVRQSMGVYHQDPEKGLVHGESLEVLTIISVVSFSNRDIPILVGYRVPEASLSTYRPILERIINSVTISE